MRARTLGGKLRLAVDASSEWRCSVGVFDAQPVTETAASVISTLDARALTA
jgi:hypothetical protein